MRGRRTSSLVEWAVAVDVDVWWIECWRRRECRLLDRVGDTDTGGVREPDEEERDLRCKTPLASWPFGKEIVLGGIPDALL